MRICNLHDGLGQLAHALNELNEAHSAVKTHWTDENSRQFEEDQLRPIAPQMQLLVAAVQALGATVDKAVRDLEEGQDF